MPTPRELLAAVSHRPYPLPEGAWRYYQEWNQALFVHWAVPAIVLEKHLPPALPLDTFEGYAYISLVAFTMQKIRPRYLPAFAPVSDFHEINLRTYIEKDSRKGVYFFSIEAGRRLSAFIARQLSGLPYEPSDIRRFAGTYDSTNAASHTNLAVEFETGGILLDKTALDIWLTERYCLYHAHKQGLYRYDIHHQEWPLRKVSLQNLNLNYQVGEVDLSALPPARVHYSSGIQVLAWPRQNI
jgi:uncharacterized protein